MKKSTTAMTALLGLALLTGAAAPLQTASASHLTRFGLIEQTWEGVAIKGYDPVAYFITGKATKGTEAFSHEWLGQIWQFASAENLDLFAADPVKYVPQYGGYCSESSKDIAEIDPTVWRMVGGRLYIFFSETSAGTFENDKFAQSKVADYWQGVKVGLLQ